MNKSKEELLKDATLRREQYMCNPPRDTGAIMVDESKVITAMDQYSKQQIISYEIWLEAELNNDASFNYGKTPEQLYDLFIQSQQDKP